jgi:Cu2+-containing amine oxidase
MLSMRQISRTLLVGALTALAADVAAGMQGHNAAEQTLKRRTHEAERASREYLQGPQSWRANNGIVQIPVDTSRVYDPSKQELEQAVARGAHEPMPPLPCPYVAGMKTASLFKVFQEVAWHVCVTDMGLKALWVGPVHLRLTPNGPWFTVLYRAGLAEIFVPYHNDVGSRFDDLRFTTELDSVNAQDAGPNGSLITLSNETMPTVVAEVRDRGIAWLCKDTALQQSRRGQEFVVWGVSDAGNYDNIVQYTFRDDGSMGFRMGNTGYNSPSHPTEAHMHNALWRVDMDLKGAGGDTAYWFTHVEPAPFGFWFNNPLKARDFETPVGVEGARRWDAIHFASLLIEDQGVNAFGHHAGYEFTPVQAGISRHFGPNDTWTQNDVYVTVYHGNELGWATNWAEPNSYLLSYLSGELVTNNDLVVWIKSSAHHDPSDEDKSVNDVNTGGQTGVTLVHWSGFDVEPHNLFKDNPLGGPVQCGP